MQDINKLQKKIESIQKKLIGLGVFRSGSISEQYNVCGKKDCKCKDKKNPQTRTNTTPVHFDSSVTRRGQTTPLAPPPKQVLY